MKIIIEVDIPQDEIQQGTEFLAKMTSFIAASSNATSTFQTNNGVSTSPSFMERENEKTDSKVAMSPGQRLSAFKREPPSPMTSSGKMPASPMFPSAGAAEREALDADPKSFGFSDPRPTSSSFKEELESVSQGRTSTEAAAEKILARLEGSSEQYAALDAAFLSVLFDSKLVADRVRREVTCVPVVRVLTYLPQTVQTTVKEDLLKAALKVFRVFREPDCNRMEFYGHAEAVAALVLLELAPASAAVKTIITLMKIPENRSAAITLLGKTVELCSDSVKEKCDPELIETLRGVMATVTEPEFKYDLEYVEENMKWTTAVFGSNGVEVAP